MKKYLQEVNVIYAEEVVILQEIAQKEEDLIQEDIIIVKEDIEAIQEVIAIIIEVEEDINLQDLQVEEAQEKGIEKEVIIEEVEVEVIIENPKVEEVEKAMKVRILEIMIINL